MTISCAQPIVVGCATVEIRGVGSSHWAFFRRADAGGGGTSQIHLDQANEYLVVNPQTILEARPNGGIVVNGSSEFNFVFRLPYGDYPSSDVWYFDPEFPSSNSTVEYSCKFTVFGMDNAAIHSRDMSFSVLAHHNYDRAGLPLMAKNRVTIPICFCCCFPTPRATVMMTTDKSVYYPGETIQCTFWAEEVSGGFLDSEVQLDFTRKVKIVTNSGATHGIFHLKVPPGKVFLKREILHTQKVKLAAGDRCTLTIPVPSGVLPSFDVIPEASSSWNYGITLTFVHSPGVVKGLGFNSPEDCYLTVIVNSHPSSTPLVYPLKSLPEQLLMYQGLYSEFASSGGVNVAPTVAYQPVSPVEIKH